MIAIVTTNYDGVTLYYVETCLHRFVVGYTFGVVAFHDAFDCVGEDNGAFLRNFIVGNCVDYSSGSNECNAIESFFTEYGIGNFDDTLTAETVT
jgi:hypothetical protein